MVFVSLLLARKSAEEKGDMRGRKRACVATDERMEGRLRCLYIYSRLYR